MQSPKDTAQRILRSTCELLSAKGLAQVSLRDIASRAGVALSQITYYFRTRENLIVAAVTGQFRSFLGKVEQKVSACRTQSEVEALAEECMDKNLLRMLVDFTAQALWIPLFREQLHRWKEKTAEVLGQVPCLAGQAEEIARSIFARLMGSAVELFPAREPV